MLESTNYQFESLCINELWKEYFSYIDERSVRDELKLNRSDVGWYQIRNALDKRNKSDIATPVSFDAFKLSYDELSNKLRPLVYEYGFLR